MQSQLIGAFTPKTKGGALTAAERQRRCRANGKGKHRGWRATKADIERMRIERAASIAALEAEELAEAAAAAGADPIPVSSTPPTIASPAALPLCAEPAFDWTLSAMAA